MGSIQNLWLNRLEKYILICTNIEFIIIIFGYNCIYSICVLICTIIEFIIIIIRI